MPVNYENIMEKINLEVQKVLKKKIKLKDYTISYKAFNAYEPLNTFENKSDFQEFINEYQK
ncbi:2121_t:CDS:1, partial [Funneliformis geosporum]